MADVYDVETDQNKINEYQKWIIFLLCCEQQTRREEYIIDQKTAFSALTGIPMDIVNEIAENACAQGHADLQIEEDLEDFGENGC
jgi:hypothetical protein